jgi:hypothetical protein
MLKTHLLSRLFILGLLLGAFGVIMPSATENAVTVQGSKILFNGEPIKIIGLRCSNGLVTEEDTQELIDNLPVFKSYGVNTVSVFFMGSRFGDVKGFKPDTTLAEKYAKRMGRIIKAADQEGMVVIVGCLYWSTSKAKEDLTHWEQDEANQAVAHVAEWLKENEYRNVIVDPDNEGMASRANSWDIGKMITAAKAVDSDVVMGYNNHPKPPANADVLLHFSPKDGRRPYVESEGSPPKTPQGYWGAFSKEKGYYNYIRIGRYNEDMKQSQIKAAKDNIDQHNGYVFASTWIQCAPHEKVGGPFMNPGGMAKNPNINKNVKTIQEDAGIRWWLVWVKETYGPWKGALSK